MADLEAGREAGLKAWRESVSADEPTWAPYYALHGILQSLGDNRDVRTIINSYYSHMFNSGDEVSTKKLGKGLFWHVADFRFKGARTDESQWERFNSVSYYQVSKIDGTEPKGESFEHAVRIDLDAAIKNDHPKLRRGTKQYDELFAKYHSGFREAEARRRNEERKRLATEFKRDVDAKEAEAQKTLRVIELGRRDLANAKKMMGDDLTATERENDERLVKYFDYKEKSVQDGMKYARDVLKRAEQRVELEPLARPIEVPIMPKRVRGRM